MPTSSSCSLNLQVFSLDSMHFCTKPHELGGGSSLRFISGQETAPPKNGMTHHGTNLQTSTSSLLALQRWKCALTGRMRTWLGTLPLTQLRWPACLVSWNSAREVKSHSFPIATMTWALSTWTGAQCRLP